MFSPPQVGSPPQVLGKLFPCFAIICRIRITPAGAGKTIIHITTGGYKRDHPRGCGENGTEPIPAKIRAGSPPRMRGKHGGRVQKLQANRITPADAGKTVPEHIRDAVKTGSPPRMRGKLSLKISLIMPTGITPADAGKTLYPHRQRSLRKDHPRGCGENCLYEVCLGVLLGSPPRMRGKLCVNPYITAYIRITPADAGKTGK